MEHKKKDQENTSLSRRDRILEQGRIAAYERAVLYLKKIYGLEPEDVNLQPDDTVVEVDIYAEKYDLQPINNFMHALSFNPENRIKCATGKLKTILNNK